MYDMTDGSMLLLLQDVAKMTLAALRSDSTVGKTLTLAGPKAWTVPEVIALCEKFADERANVTEVCPVSPGVFLGGFEGWDV